VHSGRARRARVGLSRCASPVSCWSRESFTSEQRNRRPDASALLVREIADEPASDDISESDLEQDVKPITQEKTSIAFEIRLVSPASLRDEGGDLYSEVVP
jgi:hypothetical protein